MLSEGRFQITMEGMAETLKDWIRHSLALIFEQGH